MDPTYDPDLARGSSSNHDGCISDDTIIDGLQKECMVEGNIGTAEFTTNEDAFVGKNRGNELLINEYYRSLVEIQINNVGTNKRKPTIDYTAEEFSFLMATNFESTSFFLRQLKPKKTTNAA
ncbi:hypothetical protein Syun_006968 [Stephania yunnanensis]|uniref:Uncharacterized protein n=1 Tax=Stephania yunnanensis TaxID=152371 RepID=A0AAP0PY24_9MAGN